MLYYWRQAIQYTGASKAGILQQNTDRQAAIVNLVRDARAEYGDSLAAAMRDRSGGDDQSRGSGHTRALKRRTG